MQPQPPQQPQPFQPQQVPGYAQPQYYPPPKQGMSGGKLALIIIGIVVGLLFLGGLLVGVLAVATIPKLTEAKEKLELKQMGDLYAGLQHASLIQANRQELADMGDRRGSQFWPAAVNAKILSENDAKKTVSVLSTEPRGRTVNATTVSYTSPRADQLLELMAQTSSRTVLFTWNSRNWYNAKGERVAIAWSDGTVEWLTFEQAASAYGITQAEWADPANKLFGKKAPFQFTYE